MAQSKTLDHLNNNYKFLIPNTECRRPKNYGLSTMVYGLPQIRFQNFALARFTQSAEGLFFNLTHTLSGQPNLF